MNLHDLALYQAMNGESGGGGDSQFVRVTINVNNGTTALSLDNVLQDDNGLVTEYPSASDPNIGLYVGYYDVYEESSSYQVEALAMKYFPFYIADASTLESYEGTVKHVLLDGDIIFYADADGQTLDLTFNPIT